MQRPHLKEKHMFNKIKTTILALIAITSFSSASAMEHNHSMSHQPTGVVIHDPWVRSAPPNAPMLGLFMQISNNTNATVKLLSAYAKGYQRVELHRTTNQDGLMKMTKQEFMPINANGGLSLKPGSWHIMLIGPNTVPKEGEVVMITLKFDNGTTQMVHAVVRKGKIMIDHNHHAH